MKILAFLAYQKWTENFYSPVILEVGGAGVGGRAEGGGRGVAGGEREGKKEHCQRGRGEWRVTVHYVCVALEDKNKHWGYNENTDRKNRKNDISHPDMVYKSINCN